MGYFALEKHIAARLAVAIGMVITSALVSYSSIALAADSSLEAITNREIQRREAIVNLAQTQLAEAAMLRQAGKNDEAARSILATYQSLPLSPIAEPMRTAARAAYADAALAWAQQMLNEGRRKEALEVIDSILQASVDPTNAAAKKLQKQAADPDRYPPALTPAHTERVAKVTQLLVYGDSAINLGQYDKANATFSEVLRLDPHNAAARRAMERIQQQRDKYFTAARDHTRAKMLNGVNSQWEDTLPPADLNALLKGTADTAAAASFAMRGGRERLQAKLRTLRLPRVEFTAATLDEVIEYLRITSKDVDPEGKGVGFVIKAADDVRSRTLSLNLQDVPLEEVLRYATEMAGATFRVEEHAVNIVSLSEKSTNLISKTYRVPPDFIQTAETGPGAPGAAPADPFATAPAAGTSTLTVRRMGAKEFLESRGITFGEGASASYSASTSTLIVRNTAANIDLIDQLTEEALKSAPKQVVISVKIMQVKQDMFNEMGAALSVGQANLPGLDRVFFAGGGQADVAGAGLTAVTSGLRGSGAILGKPGVDGLLALAKGQETPSLNSVSPSQFSLLGVYTDPQIALSLTALKQSKSTDVVTNPSVVVKSGQKASIRSVREFPYPTEFDPPEIPQSTGNTQYTSVLATGAANSFSNNSGPVTPTTPTAFEVRELGTILEVEPVISADGRMVEVALTPSLTEFEGFVDYGSDIRNSIDSVTLDPLLGFQLIPGTSYIVDNPVLQPIFRKSGMTTAVNVWDGSTVVIGGLVEERRTDIADSVPVLGNIPLLGRMFQSKISKVEKQAVLFFVTVHVIDPSGSRVNTASVGAR